MITPDWNSIVGQQATLLQTRKRDGRLVGTPVTAVHLGDVAYFMTDAKTGKVKRIRNFPEVRVASSTFRGEPTGEFFEATARRLDDDEALFAQATLRKAHPIMFGMLLRARYWVKRTEAAYYELSNLRQLDGAR